MTQVETVSPDRIWDDLSFLAAPGLVADWRILLLHDTAAATGILAALPGTAEELGAVLGLDPAAVRVILDALAIWDVVEVGRAGCYAAGPALPPPIAAAVWRHHARAIRLWAREIDGRLGADATSRPASGPADLALWLEGLAVNARASAPDAVDACLARVEGARRVLDLGGGHGEYAREFARRGLSVTLQDRPEVIEIARAAGRLEDEGIRLFAGDFFECLPADQFDIVFCAGVAYTYDADRNLDLAGRVRKLLDDGGAFAVLTFLRGSAPVAPLFAVQMLAVGRGGDTHSHDEHRRWLLGAGYDMVESLELDRPGESLLLARI